MWWLLTAWIAGDFVVLCSWHQAAWGLLPLALLWCFPACRRSSLSFLLLILAGLLLSQLFLDRQLTSWLPANLSGIPLVVTGQVTGLPEKRPASGHRPASWRIKLDAVQLVASKAWPGVHQIRLSDYGNHHYQPGDKVRLRVKLYRPRGLVNPGTADYARIDLAYGTDASGSVRALLDRQSGFAPVDKLRNAISHNIQIILAGKPKAAGLVSALVVGDWRYLPDASWDLYQRSGVAHLVVISGEHLTLVAGLIWLLLRYLCVPLLWWRGWQISAQQWAVLPALLFATGYCLLAGWSVSTLRALIMLSVWLLCRLWRRNWPRHKVFALALLAVLLWHPLAPLSNGFWLSFLAVAILFIALENRPKLVSLQVLMSLSLGALAAFMFSQWGLAGVVANLVLIPVFSFVLLPAALVGALMPGMGWLLPLLAPMVRLQESFLSHLLALSPQLPIPAGLLSAILLMLAIIMGLLRFLPWPRWSLPFLLLPWLFPSVTQLASGEFQLIFFDVGQGQASLVRTRKGLVLYDMGPRWSSHNAGSSIVRPWLRKQRQPVLLAFASHGDADHVGGLNSLRQFIPAHELYSGEPWRVADSRQCEKGQHWRFAGVDFQVLWPPAGISLPSDNAYSCVVRVRGRYGSALLTGDIPQQVEFWLTQHDRLKTQVLQLAHHGSTTSNSYAFLRSTAPDYAIASVGFMNAYGQPTAVVRHKLVQFGIPLLRTDRDGRLTLTVGEQGLILQHGRSRYRPWETTDTGWPGKQHQ